MNKVLSWIKSNRRWLVPVAIALAGVLVTGLQLEHNRSLKRELENARQNMTALTDTLHTYKTANGDLLITVAGYRSEVRDLKKLSRELADQVEDYKKTTGKTPETVIKTETVTVLPEKEVVFVRDSVYMYREFDFSDSWRYLTGSLEVCDTTASVRLNPERIYADITAGLDEAGNVFVKTSNPYVTVRSLEGFTVPRPKQKKWGVGVHLGYGLDLGTFKFGPQVSVGLQYNLITF